MTAATPDGPDDVSLLPLPFPVGARQATLRSVHRAAVAALLHVSPSESRRWTSTRRQDPDDRRLAMSTSSTTTPAHALLRHAQARAADVAVEDREHATTVVADLLHRECTEWSWTSHRSDAHRADARRIVGALCREGWGPAA